MHEIAHVDGEAAFAFNLQRGYPWHRLGQPVEDFMSPEHALKEAKCDDHVWLEPTFVPGKSYTVSDVHGYMGVVGDNWEITQCGDLVALAYSIVGMTEDEAAIDTMGRLGERGERFFCHIEFPELVIDPEGVADTIRRGLFCGTAFDGSMANTLGLSNIREVCANTVRMSLGQLKQAVKVKHTANAEERMQQAAAAVGYAAAAEREMMKRAEAMLAIDGEDAMLSAMGVLWDVNDPDLPERWMAERESTREACWELYEGPTCSQAVGENGWAAYAAVTEWMDYFRPVKGLKGEAATQKRIVQTLVDDAHDVNKKKFLAAEAIFALAA